LISGRLGIAGIGLIGGSIALRARGTYASIAGYDCDPATLARGLSDGVIDAAAPALDVLVRTCDTVVIALPVDATFAALARLAGVSGPALLIDVASVKGPLAAVGAQVPNYLGTHPMAGRERSGIGAADAALFEGATWAYSPHADAGLVARVRAFIECMGARPLQIRPAEHDVIVALTSHLPQVLSVVLGAELDAAARLDGRVLDLCGPGMLSMLRLARSPESVWTPIVSANSGPIAVRLRAAARALDSAAAGLEAGESAPLMSYFASARQAADLLEERFAHDARSSAYHLPQSFPDPDPSAR
jgi:prephenate dehydrogenase